MSDKMELYCFRCEALIPKDSAFVSITRSVEQIEYDIATNREVIQVIHAEGLVTLCSQCGNKFNSDTLVNLIKISPGGTSQVTDN